MSFCLMLLICGNVDFAMSEDSKLVLLQCLSCQSVSHSWLYYYLNQRKKNHPRWRLWQLCLPFSFYPNTNRSRHAVYKEAHSWHVAEFLCVYPPGQMLHQHKGAYCMVWKKGPSWMAWKKGGCCRAYPVSVDVAAVSDCTQVSMQMWSESCLLRVSYSIIYSAIHVEMNTQGCSTTWQMLKEEGGCFWTFFLTLYFPFF
jgi:hypothetical protein